MTPEEITNLRNTKALMETALIEAKRYLEHLSTRYDAASHNATKSTAQTYFVLEAVLKSLNSDPGTLKILAIPDIPRIPLVLP